MSPSKLRLSEEQITIEQMTKRNQVEFKRAHSGGVLPTQRLEAALSHNDVDKLPQSIQPKVRALAKHCGGDVGQALWEAGFVMNFNHLFEGKDRTNLFDLLFDTGDINKELLIPLFETERIDYQGEQRYAVNVRQGGKNNRLLLQRSQKFETMIEYIGQTITIQYAIANEDTTADNNPFFDEETLQQIIDFTDGYAWVYHDEYAHRIPVSTETPLDGFLYLMYRFGADSLFPKYIGIARREVEWSGNLNNNIAGVHQDSKRGRWGDSYNNHIGGLSLACFQTPDNREPKRKYIRWMQDLFLTDNGQPRMVERKPLLQNQIYIDVLPWLDHNVEQSEQNLIKVAYSQFPDEILNDIHAN